MGSVRVVVAGIFVLFSSLAGGSLHFADVEAARRAGHELAEAYALEQTSSDASRLTVTFSDSGRRMLLLERGDTPRLTLYEFAEAW